MRLFLALAALLLAAPAHARMVQFPAADGVRVTAEAGGTGAGPVIVLFHMAGSSRGEYAAIAPRLQALGYRTLAVDQRSGGAFGGVVNETAAFVPGASFLDAVPDLVAAVAHARGTMGAARVAVVGSSYSASLVILLAGRDAGFAEAVAAFSPGEYFPEPRLIGTAAAGLAVPLFVTGARGETAQWQALVPEGSDLVTGFVPLGAGAHGASALTSPDGAEYWAALEAFLAAAFPADP